MIAFNKIEVPDRMKASYKYHELIFKQPAGTSRGVLDTKPVWFITLEENGKKGVGEVTLLPGLSFDDTPLFKHVLKSTIKSINLGIPFHDVISDMEVLPSIRFALETAYLDLRANNHILFDSGFSRGTEGININGLVWMGSKKFMRDQIERKLQDGFKCLKLKIGAINKTEEFDLLWYLRRNYSEDDLEIRVDANGAFSYTDAPQILEELAQLKIHSIEQPIKAGQWKNMAKLCSQSPIPIALDEELIGVFGREQKLALLQAIKPQYLILKPGLLGGFVECEEWISLNNFVPFNWWATSSLESNIGLSAIAQWTAAMSNPMPQGLGTGMLYINNIDSTLKIKGARLWNDTSLQTST